MLKHFENIIYNKHLRGIMGKHKNYFSFDYIYSKP